MRLALASSFAALALLGGCRNYEATDVASPPKGLGAYQRAAIHTTLARGVEASVEEVAVFETDIERRIKGDVVPDAVHGPRTTVRRRARARSARERGEGDRREDPCVEVIRASR